MPEVEPIPKPIKRTSAKAKGSRLERKVAGMMGGKRMPLSGAVGGGDVVVDGHSVECKKRKALPALIRDAFAQAQRDIAIGDPRTPLVVIEEDRGRPIVCQYLDDWIAERKDQAAMNSWRVRANARNITRLAKEIDDLCG